MKASMAPWEILPRLPSPGMPPAVKGSMRPTSISSDVSIGEPPMVPRRTST